MSRNVTIQIRWSQYEIDQISEARGSTTFSEFVRDAAITKAIETNNHVGNYTNQ